MLLFILLAVLVILQVVTRRWKMKRIIELSKKVRTGLISLPIIGQAYIFAGSTVDIMTGFVVLGRIALENGCIMGGWLGSNYYLTITDPVEAEIVLKSALSKEKVSQDLTRILLGNGSLVAPVSIWRPRRKILVPTFSPKNLNDFVEIFSRKGNIIVEQIAPEVGKGPVSLWQYLSTYTLDSVCETTMGLKFNSQRRSEVPFSKSIKKILQLTTRRGIYPLLHYDFLYKITPQYRELKKHVKIIQDFVTKAIEICRRNIANKEEMKISSTKSFLELMIESSGGDGGYSDQELLEETLVLTLAGTDTSAVASCFVLSMMARYPEIQERVANELQEVFGNSPRAVTAEDLQRLKYLEVVIKETLRLYPPVPGIGRNIEKDLQLPSGLTLVEGCGTCIHIWAIHRNKKYWGEDAEQFRPERFLEAPLKHPCAFIPFSNGPRNCVGYQYALMSMKTALAAILQNYLVKSPDDDGTNIGNIKHKPLTLSYEIMLKDADGWKVRFEKRTK